MLSETQQHFDNSDYRFKFAALYLENVNSVRPGVQLNYFKKRISIDTLFAFDNLIRNSDRGHYKPNLLFSAKDAFLIDHELALNNQDIVDINLNSLQLEDKFTKYHLFYPYLKQIMVLDKKNFFNDFTEYLRILNLNKLTPYFNQLVNEGFNDYSQPITNWVNQIKQNNTIFVDKLKGAVR